MDHRRQACTYFCINKQLAYICVSTHTHANLFGHNLKYPEVGVIKRKYAWVFFGNAYAYERQMRACLIEGGQKRCTTLGGLT